MAQLIVAGNATASQVLTGSTFSAGALNGASGQMPNNGAVNRTPSNVAQSIPAGYTTGGTVAAVVVDATKVLTGTTIAGTAGTMPENGSPVWTPNTADQALSAGHFTGGIVKGDANLIAANILSGVHIFDLVGAAAAKRWATGTGTFDTSANMTVSGLAFTPTMVIGYTASGGGKSLIFITRSVADIWNGRSGIYRDGLYAYYDSSNSPVEGVNYAAASSLTAGGFVVRAGLAPYASQSVVWYAFE